MSRRRRERIEHLEQTVTHLAADVTRAEGRTDGHRRQIEELQEASREIENSVRFLLTAHDVEPQKVADLQGTVGTLQMKIDRMWPKVFPRPPAKATTKKSPAKAREKAPTKSVRKRPAK